MEKDELRLSGRTLPMYKAYAEYFRSANRRGNSYSDGFNVSLDEMGWLLGVGVLFKPDADKVMNFLGNIAKGLEAECLTIVPQKEEYQTPQVAVNGKKFSDATAYVNLDFFRHTSSISNNVKITSRCSTFLDREKYDGTVELQAYDLAFRELNSLFEHDERLALWRHWQEKLSVKAEEADKYWRYQIDLPLSLPQNPPLQVAVDGVISSAEYIHKAVHLTNRVQEEYAARVKSLAEKLAQ